MKFHCMLVLIVWVVAVVDCPVVSVQGSQLRITPLVSGVDASFRGMAVRGPQEAWICGSSGTVLRTVDAGRSWERVAIPNASELDFRDVELLRDGTVLLMSVGEGSASRLFRSSDAGMTWRAVLINSEPNGFFDGMAFREDGTKGVLFGDPVDGQLDIYATDDAGATWQRLASQQRPKLEKGEYGFAASGSGIVVRERSIWIATGGSESRVWRSADEGESWEPYVTAIRSGNASSGIFSIDFSDQGFGIAIGGNYAEPDLDRDNVAITSDGGITWLAVPDVRMPHKACVQSLGGSRFLACGRTGVAISEDAGKSWNTVSSDGYFTLRADLDSGTGYLAGSDGRVARFQFRFDEEQQPE